MKKLMMLFVLCLMGWSLSIAGPPHGAGFGVSFGVFYSSLSPYGEWISVGADVYGWRPYHVAVGWRPYTVGRWIWTDDGWYWASDEPWGWAAYHYGRWHYDEYYGWIWIPGYDWAPAWVEWRYGGDYIGWAPLGPYAVFSMTFGVHYRHHWVTPYHWWSFVDCRHITSHHVHQYVYRHEDNHRYLGRTRGIGNVRYEDGRIKSRGPDRGYVEQRGRVRLEPATIVDASDRQGERVVRGANNRERIETYRPRIAEPMDRSTAERPSSVRKTERPIALEPRNMDVRARNEERERVPEADPVIRPNGGRRSGKEIERPQRRYEEAPQLRSQERSEQMRPQERLQARPQERPQVRPQERPQYRAPERPQYRSQEQPQLRSQEPERVMRRPERSSPSPQMVPRSAPRTGNEGARSGGGGGGRSGGDRGSSRGGSRR